MDRSIPFQVNSSPPALRGDSPGNVAAPVRRFHLQHGVVRNREKERAFGVSYQALNAPPDLISRDRHIPSFHSARTSRAKRIGRLPAGNPDTPNYLRYFTIFGSVYCNTEGVR